jgi:peptidoglycan/xylan/chitin deacetylase (PgdA/CDA1 family)
MELANHSWTHANLPRVGQAQLQHEIRDSTAEILRIHGVRPKLFRLPYGSGVNTSTIRTLIADENLVHVFWNVDTLDWQDKNSASVARRAISQITDQKKGVILFHDVHAHTPEAARLVIEHLKKLNTRFLTVGQAIEEINAHRE